MKKMVGVVVMIAMVVSLPVYANAEPIVDIPVKEKCPVCGMLVAKYQPWITQLQTDDGRTKMFDGVKDMMAYYFEPAKYGGASSIQNVYVKDYYSQTWLDGKKAYYVIGSDVIGPMGHEFIPLGSMAAAESFKKDHRGEVIVRFDEITLEKVNSMRSGMQGHKMKHSK